MASGPSTKKHDYNTPPLLEPSCSSICYRPHQLHCSWNSLIRSHTHSASPAQLHQLEISLSFSVSVLSACLSTCLSFCLYLTHTESHGHRGHENLGGRDMLPPCVSSPQATEPCACSPQSSQVNRGEKHTPTTQGFL